MTVQRATGPSDLELLIGGDSYKGHYVPPLMAEVMKEAQAKEAQAKKDAAATQIKDKAAPKTDAYSGPKSTPAPKPLSEATQARLDQIAKAPDLKTALEQTMELPELVQLAESKGYAKFCERLVEDRDTKAREAGTHTLIWPSEGNARHYGTDAWLFAAPNGKRVALGVATKDLYGYANMAANAFGTLYTEKVQRVRTGIGRILPWSTGAEGVSKAMPQLTPASLAAGVGKLLQST